MKKTGFRTDPWLWFILVAVLATGFIAGGYWYARQQVQLVRNSKYQELKSIAQLKINQIATWRNESIFGIQVYATNPLFRESAARWLQENENSRLKDQILSGWEVIREHAGFKNIVLAGLDSSVRLSLDPNVVKLSHYAKDMVNKTSSTEDIIFSDFFRCPVSGAIYIDVMAPVFDPAGRPVAVLILRLDPARDLYPLIRFWPTPSPSSETMIVAKDGSQVLFLNKLRHDPQHALTKRLPLTRLTSPAVQSVLGREGVFEGRDYRGATVVADISPVPDTHWYMVTKVDKSEILAATRYHSFFIGMVVLLLLLLTGAGSGFIYRRQRAEVYRQLYGAEKERNEILEEFRITLYSIGDGVISMDASGRIRHLNPVAERLTGWSEAEARGRPLGEVFHIIHENTRKALVDPGERVLREGGIVKLPDDALLIARDGTEHPIADSAAPINGDRDSLIGIVLVFSDVTEERKARRALRESEKRYRNFFMEDITGVFISTPEGELLDCNPAFARIMGLTSAEQANKLDMTTLFSSPAASDDLLTRLRQEKKVIDHELEMRRVDGKTIHVIENVIGKFDNSGNLVEIQGYLFDITERKKLEQQLMQAQKMEAVGRLAGGVAHDFNNKLSVIMGYSEMALAEIPKPGGAWNDYLQEILKAAQHSADLTRQLLAFARKQIIAPRVLDLNDAVTQILKMLQRLIGEDIDLVWRPDADLCKVRIDPAQIDQILANFLVNARDAISGVGRVVIRTENVVFDESYCADHAGFSPGEYVLLEVSDNGDGMDKETLANIFEPFFTTKEQGKGTGLGLATVYGIVKQNEGFINVYSEPGQGTTFRIYLPRFADQASCSPAAPAPETVQQGTETILLVEDEEAILKMARQMLESLGYTVLAVGTPVEALHRVEACPGEIHLLITDIVMPEMNGRNLADQLGSIKPALKCLFMSGYTANAIAHSGILDEGVHFIQKPFSIKDLAAKVRQALESE
ncbi:MAG: PAS domain S-box protein [Desulfobacterales bacterium]|nr:PAS domain S-box protein [Desulfobacterales bacterium]